METPIRMRTELGIRRREPVYAVLELSEDEMYWLATIFALGVEGASRRRSGQLDVGLTETAKHVEQVARKLELRITAAVGHRHRSGEE